jgi:hypothetical protein
LTLTGNARKLTLPQRKSETKCHHRSTFRFVFSFLQ